MRRRKQTQQRPDHLYSAPIADDHEQQQQEQAPSVCHVDHVLEVVAGNTRACVGETLPSFVEHYKKSKRFDKAFFEGMNEVANDLHEVFSATPWLSTPQDSNTPNKTSSTKSPTSSLFASSVESLDKNLDFCTKAVFPPVVDKDDDADTVTDALNTCWDHICKECDAYEFDEDSLPPSQSNQQHLDDSLTTKETEMTDERELTFFSEDNTVETTEVEAFLHSRWSPTGSLHSSSPSDKSVNAIVLERFVRLVPSQQQPKPSDGRSNDVNSSLENSLVVTHKDEEEHVGSAKDSLDPVPNPAVEKGGNCHDKVPSPTTVCYFDDDDDEYDDDDATEYPNGTYEHESNSSTTSHGTKVHSNGRHAAVAQADAIVRAMVEEQRLQEIQRQLKHKQKRSRFRKMFCKRSSIGEI